MSSLIAARLPARTAHEAMTTGRRYGGERRGRRAGSSSRRVAEEEVLARAVERAAGLAGKDPATLRRSSGASTRRRWPRCAIRTGF